MLSSFWAFVSLKTCLEFVLFSNLTFYFSWMCLFSFFFFWSSLNFTNATILTHMTCAVILTFWAVLYFFLLLWIVCRQLYLPTVLIKTFMLQYVWLCSILIFLKWRKPVLCHFLQHSCCFYLLKYLAYFLYVVQEIDNSYDCFICFFLSILWKYVS